MKHFVHNEVFSIRKLKVGLCSVLVAVSFLGVQSVFADEVITSTSQISMNKLSTSTTNSLESSSTNNYDKPTGIDSSISQLTDSNVDSPLISNKEYKEDGVNTGTFEDEMKDSPLVSNSDLSTSTIKTLEGSLTSKHDSLTDFISTYSKSVSSENEVADTSNSNEVRESNTALEKGIEVSALNVKDYGAVGDGVNDDRQAIQDTIDAAAKGLGGGKVYFPEGTYLVKEIVFLRSHTHLEVHEKATILNGINIKNHPSIVFMTGLFTDDGAQVEWAPTEDISYSGGTIDMNGALNEEGTKAKNLPLINSSGAFAIGNSNNVTIKNVTFKDSYQGHAIQIAGSKNVLVDNSRFLGQALPKTMKDGQIISKESIQIEPLTRKGFPYALNDDGKKSENVTIQNSYFGDIIKGISNIMDKNNLHMLVYSTDENIKKEKKVFQNVIEQRPSGIILSISLQHHKKKDIKVLLDSGIPFVLFDRQIFDETFTGVFFDDIKGGYLATEALINSGHENIAIITGPFSTTNGLNRLEGYKKAMLEKNKKISEENIYEGNFHFDSGYENTKKILEKNKEITAIFICNNEMTLGALQAIREKNLKIPDDIAIVSYDNHKYFEILGINISAINRDIEETGMEIAKLLLEEMKNSSRSKKIVIVSPTLILRNSEKLVKIKD